MPSARSHNNVSEASTRLFLYLAYFLLIVPLLADLSEAFFSTEFTHNFLGKLLGHSNYEKII